MSVLIIRTIQASLFEARCLALMDDVAAGGEPLLTTRHGKPIAELQPRRPPRATSLIGIDKGRGAILGDTIEPAWQGEWDALR